MQAAEATINAQKLQLADDQKRLDTLYTMKSQLEQYTEGIKGYQEDFKGLNKDLRDLREYAGNQFQKLTGDTAANTTAIDRTKADLSEKIGGVGSDLDKHKTDTNTRLETIKSDLLNARTDLRDSLKRMDDTQQKLEARVNETVKRLTDTFWGPDQGLAGTESGGETKKPAGAPAGK